MRHRKSVDPDVRGGGEELAELEGGKIIRMYHRSKESVFNKRQNMA